MATIAEVAIHLDLSERRVGELQAKGTIPKSARGQLDLDACRIAYIRHMRGQASGRSEPGELDPAQERARKDKETADQTAMRNAQMRGELVPVADVVAQVDREYGVVRERFLGLSGKMSGALAPDQVQRLEGEIREALEDLSNPQDLDTVQEARAKQARIKRRG